MAPAETYVVFRYGAGEKGRGIKDGQRLLNKPRGFSVLEDGALLVADYGNHCVIRFPAFKRKGKVVAGEEGKNLPDLDLLKDIDKPMAEMRVEGEGILLKRPSDVCMTADNAVLVLDTGKCRAQAFGGRTARSVAATTLMPPPGAPEQKSVNTPDSVKYPRAMILQRDGRIVVCDTWAHRILRFPAPKSAEEISAMLVAARGQDSDEVSPFAPEVLAGFPNSCGPRLDQMAFPSGIAFDKEGALLVTDTNNHRILRFTPPFQPKVEGQIFAGRRDCTAGSQLNELNMPTGICVDDGDGSVYVTDRMNSRVLKFASGSSAHSEGTVVAGPDVLDTPWGVALGAEKSLLYVSDERRAAVFCVDLDGRGADIVRASQRQPEEVEQEPVLQVPPSQLKLDPLIKEVEPVPAKPAFSPHPRVPRAEAPPPPPLQEQPSAPEAPPPQLCTVDGDVGDLD